MIRVELLAGLVMLALWIFSLIDVIGSDEGAIRHLPKVPWLLIVLFFPLAGSVAWLAVGRPVQLMRTSSAQQATAYPEDDRPGRAAGTAPAADEAFLRQVRERAEEQRRAYRESRRAPDPDPET